MKIYDDGIIQLHHGDARQLTMIKGGIVQLVLTSPPFNAGMEYELDLWETLEDYYQFLRDSFSEAVRVLRPGGWCIIEVGDMHISPEHPHARPGQKEQDNMGTAALLTNHLKAVGMYYKGEAIWNRGRWTNKNAKRLQCAPGSPAVLVQHSKILFFRKPGGRKGAYQYPQLDTRSKTLWCRSVWDHVQPVSHSYHPAVMPPKMAEGIIHCWSVPSDEPVLDLFCGIGTVPFAAKKQGRRGIGVDAERKYLDRAMMECSQGVLLA